ncbi:MAG TPA: hypothetical protein VMR34_05650 [Candidatus Saccharimonadales bacterium]|nr:hypothetical protein [Candidatus Saccharimonadales bacterium]
MLFTRLRLKKLIIRCGLAVILFLALALPAVSWADADYGNSTYAIVHTGNPAHRVVTRQLL